MMVGYLEDNIIDQHIDDYHSRSENNPNVTSGVKSVIIYKYKGTNRRVIYGENTKKVFDSSDSYNDFHIYYALPDSDKELDYYLIIVTDFAGNVSKKKLTCKQSLLTWFHTSIDRSTYD